MNRIHGRLTEFGCADGTGTGKLSAAPAIHHFNSALTANLRVTLHPGHDQCEAVDAGIGRDDHLRTQALQGTSSTLAVNLKKHESEVQA